MCYIIHDRYVRLFVRTVRCVYVRSDCVLDPAVAVRCPFHDAYYFSYQDAVHEMCEQPLSYAKPCVGATDYQLHFKHCQPTASLHAKGSYLSLASSSSDLQSFDFVINRFFMKLFTTKSIENVKYCQEYFDFSLPSVLCAKRVAKFEVSFGCFCLCYNFLI